MGRTICRKCHRRLTDPQSQARGFGPVCWQKSMRDDGIHHEGTNINLMQDDPNYPDDVFFQRLLDGNIETNVKPVQLHHSPSGFNWGYGGSGPADLALNILLRFTDKETAWRHHQDFKWEFIAKIQDQGARIKGETIKRWLTERQAKD